MEELTIPTKTTRKVHKTEDKTPPPPGHNQPEQHPDAATILFFIGQIRKDQAEMAVLRKRAGKTWKMAINAGIVRKDLAAIMAQMEMAPEAVAKMWDRLSAYAVAAGVHKPEQQLSFLEPNSARIRNHSERQDEARKMGFARGIMGENPDTQAFGADHEFHQVHMDGWHEGQADLLKRIVTLNPENKPDTEQQTAAE